MVIHEVSGDSLTRDTHGKQTFHDARLIILEVDIRHLVTGTKLLSACKHGEPALAGFGRTLELVNATWVQQQLAILTFEHGRYHEVGFAREDGGEVHPFPGITYSGSRRILPR